MRLLKQFFEFYVFGNIHVALAAYCLTKITFLIFDIQNHSLALFVFFSTILSYNLIRFFQLDKINSTIAVWIKGNTKGLLVLNVLALAGVLYYAFQLRIEGFMAILPFFIATVFYVLPLKNKASGLRHIPGLKLFLIAFAWAGITLYFPIQEAGLLDVSNQWIYFMQRFLFIVAITIPFDIRDAQFDLPDLATIPQVFGIKNAKIIAIAAMILFLGIDYFILEVNSNVFLMDAVLTFLSALLIMFTSARRKRFYTAFWVETLPIFWYIWMLLFVE